MQRNPYIVKTNLSEQKDRFLRSQIKTSYQLSVDDLRLLIKNKYAEIKIIINGDTPLGVSMMAEHKKELLEEINLYKNETKYAIYLQKNYISKKYVDRNDLDNELFDIVNSYLDESKKKLRRNLSPTELEEIQLACANSNEISQFIDTKIEDLLEEELELAYSDSCLNKPRMIKEVLAIQNSLPADEYVGYIFTNDHARGHAHFEVLIISQQFIFKPVNWNIFGKSINSNDFEKLYSPLTKNPLITGINLSKNKSLFNDEFPLPQARDDGSACGTLGLMYLKELLKNNAHQLKHDALYFAYYNNEEKLCFHFLPPPQVLRYSQSEAYNKLLVATLEKEEFVTLRHDNKEYKVITLETMLRNSIQIADKSNDLEIKKQNEALLAELPKLSDEWLQKYQLASEKRQLMSGKNFNLYLIYSSRRLELKCLTKMKEEKEIESEPESIIQKKDSPLKTEKKAEFLYALGSVKNKKFKPKKLLEPKLNQVAVYPHSEKDIAKIAREQNRPVFLINAHLQQKSVVEWSMDDLTKNISTIFFKDKPISFDQFDRQNSKYFKIWHEHLKSINDTGLDAVSAIFNSYYTFLPLKRSHKDKVRDILTFIDANKNNPNVVLDKLEQMFNDEIKGDHNANGNYYKMLAYTIHRLKIQKSLPDADPTFLKISKST